MKKLIDIRYRCPVRNCPNKLWISNEWTEEERAKKVERLHCKDHQNEYYKEFLKDHNVELKNERKRPLTDWEREKLSFTRSDKAWEDHIKHRKNVTGGDGKKHTILVDDTGNVKREVPIPK